jgi:hypothetical protein
MDKKKKGTTDDAYCPSALPILKFVATLNDKVGEVKLKPLDDSVKITPDPDKEEIGIGVDIGVKTLKGLIGDVKMESSDPSLLSIGSDPGSKTITLTPTILNNCVTKLNTKTGEIIIKSEDHTIAVNDDAAGIIDLSAAPSIAGVASLNDVTGNVTLLSTNTNLTVAVVEGKITLTVQTVDIGVKTLKGLIGDVKMESSDPSLLSISSDPGSKTITLTPSIAGVASLNDVTGDVTLTSSNRSVSIDSTTTPGEIDLTLKNSVPDFPSESGTNVYFLSGQKDKEGNIYIEWRLFVPPIPPSDILNLEDCVEGTSLNGYNNLSFSGILEDSNYANFHYQSYYDFDSGYKSYWCPDSSNYSYFYDDFVEKDPFMPYGKDILKECGKIFMDNNQAMSHLSDPSFFYNIEYVFWSQNLGQQHRLKFRLYFSGHHGYSPNFYCSYNIANGFLKDNDVFFIPDQPGSDPANNFLSMALYILSANSLSVNRQGNVSGINAIDNIFDFSGSDDWIVESISASRDFIESPDWEEFFEDVFPEFEHVTAENVEEFKAAYGYLMSGFKISHK